MQAEFSDALLEDLDRLIRLHDRGLDTETLNGLKVADFPTGTSFCAVVADLMHVRLLRFRNLLDQMHDRPPPAREQMAGRIHKKLSRDKPGISPIRFMAGAQVQNR